MRVETAAQSRLESIDRINTSDEARKMSNVLSADGDSFGQFRRGVAADWTPNFRIQVNVGRCN